MRHIRDPVTGRCVVCDKYHAFPDTTSDQPSDGNSKASWDNVRKKMIYVNAFSRPTTAKKPADAAFVHPKRDGETDSGITDPSVVSASRVFLDSRGNKTVVREHHQASPVPPSTAHSTRTDSTVPGQHREIHHYAAQPTPPPTTHHVYHGNPGYDVRDNSPERSGCCGGRRNDSYGHNTTRNGARVGDRNDSRYVSNYKPSGYRGPAAGSSVGRRRCCACLCAFLLLALLAGIIAGIYFGVKAAKDAERRNSPEVVYAGSGGYYVNGVYIIPVTENPSEIYLIYGEDIPCNENNNNTDVTMETPNCDEVTTRIALANWTTTTTTTLSPVIVTAGSAGGRYVTEHGLCLVFAFLFYSFLNTDFISTFLTE